MLVLFLRPVAVQLIGVAKKAKGCTALRDCYAANLERPVECACEKGGRERASMQEREREKEREVHLRRFLEILFLFASASVLARPHRCLNVRRAGALLILSEFLFFFSEKCCVAAFYLFPLHWLRLRGVRNAALLEQT